LKVCLTYLRYALPLALITLALITTAPPVEVPVIDYRVTAATGVMMLLVGFLLGYVLRTK
jgi:hypothetical protein